MAKEITKPIEQEEWYQIFIETLKTRKKPKNFRFIRKKMLNAFRKEIEKRMKNILKISRFERRKFHKENYRFRKEVIKRDGKECINCKKNLDNKRLEIAHILPVGLFPEFAFEIWNGQVKCGDCHKKEPNYSFRKVVKDVQDIKEINEKFNSTL